MNKLLIAFLTSFCALTLYGQDVDYGKWNLNATNGQAFTSPDSAFITYAIPEGYPFTETAPRFNVSVNDQAYTALYADPNFKGKAVTFGSVDIADGTEVTIKIAVRSKFNTAEILPHSAQYSDLEVRGTTITFKVSHTPQNFTVVLDDQPVDREVLHLFVNDIDREYKGTRYDGYKFDRATKTYFFGPGYYDLSTMFSNGTLQATAGRNIYLAGGAVVNGTLGMTGSTPQATSKIYGRGMVMNTAGTLVSASQCTAGEIKDIMCHGHRKWDWQITLYKCSNFNLHHLKTVSTRYASTDGLDVTLCQDCEFDNLFLRACDDAVAIKGANDVNNSPQNYDPNTGLHFSHMQLWSDCNNGFGLGAETGAREYRDISLTDSEILFSYDDVNNHCQLDERSALNICCLHGTTFSDIRFSNIKVHYCERLIGMGFKPDFWFGSIQGNQTWPGGIHDVHFTNITCPRNSGSAIANDIWLYAWQQDGTPTKSINDIYFDNVVVDGQRLESASDTHIKTNNPASGSPIVYDLHFNEDAGIQGVENDASLPRYSNGSLIFNPEIERWEVCDMLGNTRLQGTGSHAKLDTLPVGAYIAQGYARDAAPKVLKFIR